jgi:hypothetical protein
LCIAAASSLFMNINKVSLWKYQHAEYLVFPATYLLELLQLMIIRIAYILLASKKFTSHKISSIRTYEHFVLPYLILGAHYDKKEQTHVRKFRGYAMQTFVHQ